MGCLLGGLGQELSGVSEVFRRKVEACFSAIAARMAVCLEEARQRGDIPADSNPRQMASLLVDCWEGAARRSRLRPGGRRLAPDRRCGEVPFEVALPALLGLVLKGREQAAAAAEVAIDTPAQISREAVRRRIVVALNVRGPGHRFVRGGGEGADPPRARTRMVSSERCALLPSRRGFRSEPRTPA